MVKKRIRALVMHTAGTNCDRETRRSLEVAGAYSAQIIHINAFLRCSKQFSGYDILVIPGGFSYGDDISAGRLLANELRFRLTEAVTSFTSRGGIILGICNGFQVLVKAGLLMCRSGLPAATFSQNDSGRFECRWVYLKVTRGSFITRGLPPVIYLPVAHAEGKLVLKDRSVLKGGEGRGKVFLRYSDCSGSPTRVYPLDPNGSFDSIAGVSDEKETVFGIMPHPERYIYHHNHPHWHSQRALRRSAPPGLRIFRNIIREAGSR